MSFLIFLEHSFLNTNLFVLLVSKLPKMEQKSSLLTAAVFVLSDVYSELSSDVSWRMTEGFNLSFQYICAIHKIAFQKMFSISLFYCMNRNC